MLLRVYLTVLRRGRGFREDLASEPYRTLAGYFDALREGAGVRRLIEDEVKSRAGGYVDRKRVREAQGVFDGRDLDNVIIELTSRTETGDAAGAERRPDLSMAGTGSVDATLAANPAGEEPGSPRLDLMVILGQPRTTSEYVRITSRAGSDWDKPGLVVTVLNSRQPRDREHFERFGKFHKSFYRAAEFIGVTPFSARALDRDLAAVTVALARHGHKPMTAPGGADAIVTELPSLGFVPEVLGKLAEAHVQGDPGDLAALRRSVENKADSLLEGWEAVSKEQQAAAVRMKYYENEGNEPAFLLHNYQSDELSLLPTSNWKARFGVTWSMRDPEPAVNLSVQGPGGLNLDEDKS